VTSLLVSQPLHFGDYGGLPLKIIWALLDVIAIVVLASGLYLWLRKRRPVLGEDASSTRNDDDARATATDDAAPASPMPDAAAVRGASR
jgi:uncharacterized iron-regulated membrane protein